MGERARAQGRRNGNWMRYERGAVLMRAPGGAKGSPGRIRLRGMGIKAQEGTAGVGRGDDSGAAPRGVGRSAGRENVWRGVLQRRRCLGRR